MKREAVESFIEKYTLNGMCNSATCVVTNNVAATRVADQILGVISEVSYKGIGFPNGTYPIFDAKKLLKLLSVLHDDIDVQVETDSSNTPINFVLTSGDISVIYVLADESIIPAVKEIKKDKGYDIKLTLEDGFSASLIKSNSAVSDSNTLNIKTKANTIEFIIGELGNYSNKIKLKTTIDSAVGCSLKFLSVPLITALLVNKDATSKTLFIDPTGLMKLECVGGLYKATYYFSTIA